MKQIIIKSILLALMVSVVGARPAFAYVDPNTGGMLFQLLAVIFAFFSAILLFFSSYIKMALARVKRFLRNFFTRKPNELA